jgi:hypothetical protein
VAELPEHEVRQVSQYVESQTHDEDDPVTLVQKVGSRRIGHVTHDLYDVWMKKGSRWWVISPPTNLYDQADFNSIDLALTHHLGIVAMLRERSRTEWPDEAESASPAWRKFLKAVDAMSEATEAEDYQAVGIRCREALLAYVRERSTEEWGPPQETPPQTANFKGWADIFAATLVTASKPRSYLKSLADKTWDLTVWLQHYTDADEWDAEMVLDATAHLLKNFDLAILMYDHGDPRRCPQCDSYRVMEDGGAIERDGRLGWLSQEVCSACGWRGDESFEAYSADHLRRMIEYQRGAEGGEEEQAETAH